MYFEFPGETQLQEEEWMETTSLQSPTGAQFQAPQRVPDLEEQLVESAMVEMSLNQLQADFSRRLQFQEQEHRPLRLISLMASEMTDLQVHLILMTDMWILRLDTRTSSTQTTLGPSSSMQETPRVRWQISTRTRYASLLEHSMWSWLIIIDQGLRNEWYLTTNSLSIESPDILLDSFLSQSGLTLVGQRQQ
ncbi:NSs [Telok Forest virus]|uniref:Non-structural protein NS-S n=1 Tax=Telok Forest virus TaxID=2748198 RepID=A0A7D9MVT7_9VIRU|nr:NSs [Telok Forest virus]QLA47019.1 NSs [Telok Forest virus]